MADGQLFNDIYLGGRGGTNPGQMRVHSGGLVWKKKGGEKAVEVDKGDIAKIYWMKVPRSNQLGIRTKDGLSYKFIGFRDQEISMLSNFFRNSCGIVPEEKKLSVSGHNWGEVDFNAHVANQVAATVTAAARVASGFDSSADLLIKYAFCLIAGEVCEVMQNSGLSFMETLAATASLPIHQQSANYDELYMQQSIRFADSLKDLKNLKTQLYSAAEYFELSYINDDQKDIVVETLKDYAIKAIINTVDHLGSVTYKVNDLLEEKAEELSATEQRVSCMG